MQPMQTLPDFDALARLLHRGCLGLEIPIALGCALPRGLLHFVSMVCGTSGWRRHELVGRSLRHRVCNFLVATRAAAAVEAEAASYALLMLIEFWQRSTVA